MVEWWNALTEIEKVFAVIAMSGTLLLLIQTIMLIIGLGHGDADVDRMDAGADVDANFDGQLDGNMDAPDALHGDGLFGEGHDHLAHEAASDAGLHIFTVRGAVAFFCVFGWLGIIMLKGGASTVVASLVSAIAGLGAMVLMALILKWSLKLQASGNILIYNAMGKSGEVYIAIPANRQGRGKVTVLVQERLCEFDAVTDHEEKLTHGMEVTVLGVSNQNTLVVMPK